jgi:hypothetical protein
MLLPRAPVPIQGAHIHVLLETTSKIENTSWKSLQRSDTEVGWTDRVRSCGPANPWTLNSVPQACMVKIWAVCVYTRECGKPGLNVENLV